MTKNIFNHNLSENEFNQLANGQEAFRRIARYKVPYLMTKEEALLQLKSKIAKANYSIEQPENNLARKLYWIGSIAASILLLFGIWQFWIRKPLTEIVTENAQQNDYKLPDGSNVFMNSGSKVSFNKSDFNKKRCLSFEGEAFFNISKGKPFIINTKCANIKILGTSFNVFARETFFKVSCLTGKILISSGNQSLVLLPGESSIFAGKTLVKFQDKNISTAGSWRNGEFFYENVALNIIFKEIERQFNVKFALPKIEDKFFTGSFSNKNLVNTLDIVCIPMGLTYEIGNDKKIFIRKKL
jgi:transmembrane sensor